MRLLIKGILLLTGLFVTAKLSAQTEEVHARWSYEAKKKAKGEYELIFHLKLEKGWHIWSLKPGGDGFLIAPSFDIDDNPDIVNASEVVEQGKVIKSEMDGVDGTVAYLSEKVDYVIRVKVKGKTTIKGTHTYQICNDRMCLPPTDEHFELEIK